MREVARSGCRVMLLTLDTLANAPWPREILDEVFTMPDGLTYEQIKNTVTCLGRSHHFDRIVALDEFDLQHVAALREHMRIPGMGISTTAHFRDKLTMRSEAKRIGLPGAGIHVDPELRRFAGLYVVGALAVAAEAACGSFGHRDPQGT